MQKKSNCGVFEAGHTTTHSFFLHLNAQLRSKAGQFDYTKTSFVDCHTFEVYMLHCRTSQVWLAYNSNEKRNPSSHCSSSRQSSTLLVNRNVMFCDCPEKTSLNWKGQKTSKINGPEQDCGVSAIYCLYSQFDTNMTLWGNICYYEKENCRKVCWGEATFLLGSDL